ncbi:hypothetical protein RRX38_08765 [Pseudomonas sp. DTU_2021_1001937_2_SI_NGA_ILE_001]|uniref:hypothetical protein n=1 Tax=Pseudomonas sp. DTU_2021_1001937_2_SI_NGA_ILE_001 TaxID=3077589 RepID=UPI0028FC299A|nr:hypothetical protein [Pseudomonas sp. DTU_2021_1001937_2_SI_NGA_ILE_001]WNW11241.1 hypothetical protein RRX38_08765 [Pseudomonas sp. DTU_2021_1001937_2_SI_NGA_ILE_001]
MEIRDVIHRFEAEFSVIADRFHIRQLAVSEAAACAEDYVAHPGVYVFWRPGGVVKVGRHLTNARKRALEHIVANTGGSMAELITQSDARLLLFSLINPADRHWAAAVEIYLESQLNPSVKAARLG